MKTCTKCKKEKPFDDFSPDKRATTGRQSRCRECTRIDKNEAYARNPEKARKRQNDYYKNNREAILATNAKSRAKHADKIKVGKKAWYDKVKNTQKFQERLKAVTIANKDAKREYDKEYRAKIPLEERNARAAAWKARNPKRRAAIIATYTAKRRQWEGSGMSGGELADWIERQNKNCHWCKKDCLEDYHVDHVMPLSKGGAHEAYNLAISCPSCNYRKSAKHPLEWLAELGYDPK